MNLQAFLKDPVKYWEYGLRKLGIPYRLSRLQHIVLYANTVCNAKCSFCDVGQANRGGTKDKGISKLRQSSKKHLPISLLKKILEDDYVIKQGVTFNLLMTEPLLSPQISEYVKMISERNHFVRITTNGYLLAEKAHDLVESGLDAIQVSINGPQEIDDSIRGRGFYNRSIEGIKRIREEKPDIVLGVHYAVSNINDTCLSDFVTGLATMGTRIDYLRVALLDFISEQMQNRQNRLPVKQTASSLSDIIDPEMVDIQTLQREIENSIEVVKRNQSIRQIQIVPPIWRDTSLMQRYFSKEGLPIEGYTKCEWPFTQMAIKTDGSAIFHMRCFDYEIGNVAKKSVRQVFHSGKARHFRRQFMKSNSFFPACSRCCGVMLRGNQEFIKPLDHV